MKKIFYLLLISFIQLQIDATVKVFVNDSSKTFLIRIYDGKNNATAITLQPGAIQDVFLNYDVISQIVIQDEKHMNGFKTMAHHTLNKMDYPFNKYMVLIVHKDASVSMYQGTTTRDESLKEIDAAYMKNMHLPTIDLSIHTTRTDQPWSTQSVNYSLKSNKSFTQSVKALFKFN